MVKRPAMVPFLGTERAWNIALSVVGWIVRGEFAAPEVLEAHWEEIRNVALRHRVAGRMVESMLKARTAESHRAVFEKLSALHSEVIWEQMRAEEVMESFFTRMVDLANECVVVKGLSVFLNNRNPFSIKNSSDRDVILPDSMVAHAMLARLSLEEYKPPVQHEELNVIYQDHCFDFHKHFPVWVRRGGAVRAGADWVAGAVRHDGNVLISSIAYEDIVGTASRRIATSGVTVYTPSPAVAALVQIVHFYRDVIRLSVISLRHRPRVRLQELLDIRDLLRHPQFDPVHFRELTARYESAEQSRVAGSFIFACLEDAVLLDVLGQTPMFDALDQPARFVLDAWHGFAFELVRRPSEFLFSRIVAPTVVPEVGPNRRSATQGPVRVALHDGQSIVHTHGRVKTFSVSLAVTAQTQIQIEFEPEERSSGALCAFICIGMQYFHFNFEAEHERNRVSASYLSEVLSQDSQRVGSTHRLALTLSFDPEQQDPKAIHAMVCVGMLRPDGILDVGAMAALMIDQPAS